MNIKKVKRLGKLTKKQIAAIPAWRDKWIANAMSTKPMDDAERAETRTCIKGLYEVAGLKPPPDHRIVFVPSPFVLRFAAGFAAWVWHCRKNKIPLATDQSIELATSEATDQATRQATYQAAYQATAQAADQATHAATYQATYLATYQATHAAIDQATDQATRRAAYQATVQATSEATVQATHVATVQATEEATDQATNRATREATREATDQAIELATLQATLQATYQATDQTTRQATYQATYQATDQATEEATRNDNWFNLDIDSMIELSNIFGGAPALICAQKSYSMWDGGNQWSGWNSWLSLFRHVLMLDIDYSKYAYYERLAEISGPRCLHPEFAIVCDRPLRLTIDNLNRPHNQSGPFCEWRDGSRMYSWHGVNIPAWWIEHKERLRPEIALAWRNIEQRRAAAEILGWDKIIDVLGARVIDKDPDPEIGELLEVDLPGAQGERFLRVRCATGRSMVLVVPKEVKTALEANAATYDLPKELITQREIRT